MAQWKITGRAAYFDDGLTAQPGDPDWTIDAVKAEAKTAKFDYVGTPNWAPPVVESDAA